MRSLEARLKRVEEKLEWRLALKRNRPFLVSDVSTQDAAAHIERCKVACQTFFREFGGKPPVEPDEGLPIHEELPHWVQQSVNIFIAFLSALGHGDEGVIERVRALPELVPWLEMAENCVNKRSRAGIGL